MAASFSGNAKAEICRSIPHKKCCAIAQCFGILLFCNTFTEENIRIITESKEFADMLPPLFKKAFGISFDVTPQKESKGKISFQITDREKISVIMHSYGFDPADTLALHINLAMVEEDCCKTSFLRGAFLAGGSVTDPVKGYHLELATTHHSVAREGSILMEEVLSFCPKTAQRGGGLVLYLKNSEQISDCLTFLGAPVAAMAVMETRLEKDLNNKVNRRCNCDEANTSKVVEAAQEQIMAIRFLRESGVLSTLSPKLIQAAEAREQHPESNLIELASIMVPPISKPAMNHRLRNLVRLAKEKQEI